MDTGHVVQHPEPMCQSADAWRNTWTGQQLQQLNVSRGLLSFSCVKLVTESFDLTSVIKLTYIITS